MEQSLLMTCNVYENLFTPRKFKTSNVKAIFDGHQSSKVAPFFVQVSSKTQHQFSMTIIPSNAVVAIAYSRLSLWRARRSSVALSESEPLALILCSNISRLGVCTKIAHLTPTQAKQVIPSLQQCGDVLVMSFRNNGSAPGLRGTLWWLPSIGKCAPCTECDAEMQVGHDCRKWQLERDLALITPFSDHPHFQNRRNGSN